jgi:hypothetical protein
MFLPLEGLDWLWGSGLKKKLGLDLGPGWPFKIIGNFFEFPLLIPHGVAPEPVARQRKIIEAGFLMKHNERARVQCAKPNGA